jgi:hypothetical protein
VTSEYELPPDGHSAETEPESARDLILAAVAHLGLVTFVVREYDPAVTFFVDARDAKPMVRSRLARLMRARGTLERWIRTIRRICSLVSQRRRMTAKAHSLSGT